MQWCGEGGLFYPMCNTRRKVFCIYMKKEGPTSFKPDIANGLHHMAMSRYFHTGLPKSLP